MPNYRTKVLANLDNGTVVQVQSSLCTYHVSEQNGKLVIFAPGLEETYFIGEQIPEELPTEQRALVAILLWEET